MPRGSWKPGEKVPGAGRPKGSISIHSQRAVQKLEELGFDPIEEMVKLKKELDVMIAELRAKPNPSHVAISNLQNTRQKIINDLMRYGYGRTPEITEEKQNLEPIKIELSVAPKPKEDPENAT